MLKRCGNTCLSMLFLLTVCSSCQRDEPAEKSVAQPPQPVGAVEQAVEQTIDGIKGPMDKARSVEGMLEKSAERAAEQMQDATQ